MHIWRFWSEMMLGQLFTRNFTLSIFLSVASKCAIVIILGLHSSNLWSPPHLDFHLLQSVLPNGCERCDTIFAEIYQNVHAFVVH